MYAEMAKAVTRLAGTVTTDRYKVDVIRFIGDRTFGFQKLSEVIPVRHFLDGVQSAAKGITCAGLGMSPAKLYACLSWAREQGVVVTKKVGRKVRYAIKLDWLLSLVPPKTRDKIAPALNLVDDKWGAEVPREHLHLMEVSAPGYLHEVEVHLKNHSPYGVREQEKSSARKLAPVAGPGASPFSEQKEGAHAPVEATPAAATAVDVPPASPAAAPPAQKVAKRGRPLRELWGSTLWNRFDVAFREAWPDAPLPAEASIKLQAQWEHVATHWRRTDIGPGDWIEWCVKHWRTVYMTVFRHVEHTQEREAEWRAKAPGARKRQWRTDVDFPNYPDFGFLYAYRTAFEVEYGRRDSQMTRTGLLPGARWLCELLRNGWPPEDAQREVDARLAKRKFIEDLEQRERAFNDKVRWFESKMQLPENRLMLARIRSGRDPEATWVKPVALAKPRVKPDFSRFSDNAPLPPIPAWRDDLDEGPELSAVPGISQSPLQDPVQAGCQR